MKDLIDRQAALQAMDTWDKFGCGPDGKLVRYDDDNHYVPYVHYDDMVHAIKHLPSAQPEQRWIPVTERMPEVGKSVLICDADGDICIGHRTRFGYYFPDFCDDKIKDARAWAGLPEPYREEEQDD